MLGLRAPGRGLIGLDAVLFFGILARPEGRPAIAVGYVLFREPNVIHRSHLFEIDI
jgi:hypothetical protein